MTKFNRANLHSLVCDGQIFSVEFIKRTDGSLRRMVCRLGVTRHLKGGDAAYDAKAKNLLCVFDMEKGDYRSIPVESVRSLSVHGQRFDFAQEVAARARTPPPPCPPCASPLAASAKRRTLRGCASCPHG